MVESINFVVSTQKGVYCLRCTDNESNLIHYTVTYIGFCNQITNFDHFSSVKTIKLREPMLKLVGYTITLYLHNFMYNYHH